MGDILEYGRINGFPNILRIAFFQDKGYMRRHTFQDLLIRIPMHGIPLW